MAEQLLRTKIALKIKTLKDWTDNWSDYKPLRGEVCLCEIPANNANATNAPTVLFKVGDGQSVFSELKWVSALAADVHSWAKKSETEFVTWVNEQVNHPANVDTQYIFAETDGKLVVKKATYTNGVKGAETSVGEYDFVTPSELTTILNSYYTKTEADGRFAPINVDTGVHAVSLTGGTNNGTLKLTVDGQTTDNIAVTGLQNAAYTTVASLNNTAKGYADDAESAAKQHAEQKVNALANGAVAANASAISTEASRAAEEEARLAGLIGDNAEAIAAEILRAKAAEKANADAIELLTNGVDQEKVDGVVDLINYVEEHGPEVQGIKNDIGALEGRLDIAEPKIQKNIDDIAEDKKALADYKTLVGNTYETKTDASEKLTEAKGYTDTEIGKEKERALGVEGGLRTDVNAVTQELSDYKTTVGNTYETKEDAGKKLQEAKGYADSLASNYATAAQGATADAALQTVEVGTGLKVSTKASNKQIISIDEDCLFIFDCND